MASKDCVFFLLKYDKTRNISTIFVYKNEEFNDKKYEISYREYGLKNPKREVFDIFFKNCKIKLLNEDLSSKQHKLLFKKEFNSDIAILKTGIHPFGFRAVLSENKTSKKKNENSEIEAVNKIDKVNKRKKIITIDAGHGGKDPGAIVHIGKKRIQEKDLALEYAIMLAEELEKLGFQVILTRKTDMFLKLEERVKIARNAKSDFMLSIHFDKAQNKRFYGTTIYAIEDIDQHHPDWGRFNNYSYIPLNILKQKNTISTILINIMHKEIKITSDSIAEEIKDFMVKNDFKRCYKKSKSLAVLRAIDMPALLIEVGYLSNKNELEKILNEKYKKHFISKLAKSIERIYDR